MARWRKIGIIAGGGDLPLALCEHFAATGQPYWVARVEPFADDALSAHPGESFNIGKMGARIEALRAAGVDALTMVGIVKRADLSQVEFDEHGATLLPKLAAAARSGDDALLRVLVEDLEAAGFTVIGAEEALADLKMGAGALGKHAPNAAHRADIAKAALVADALGSWDVGQAVAVCDGLVLAIEAQEGTDEMLARVAALDGVVRGSREAPRGVLLKRPKTLQERRVDLPTIGTRTVENAATAGLAGIALEAGGALVLRREAVIAKADEFGLFVYGFTADEAKAP
ncbi:MAG: LpxI family protein [Hyphomonadaceae bacterium]